jgi:O-antigen ligase
LVYVVLTFTRLPELLPIVLGHNPRLGLIATLMAILVILLSGGPFRVISSKIVMALAAFTVWFYVCIPFSYWRGGSFNQGIAWLMSLISLILLAGCIEGLEQCRRAMYAMAVAVLTMDALSFVFGTLKAGHDSGRLSFVSGTLANANDLATLLLMGLPFCLLVVRTRSGFSILRMASFCGLLIIPITIVRTGSRGGLLALLIMFAIYFFSLPVLQRIPLAVGALVLAVVAVVFSNGGALDRYKVLFVDSNSVYADKTAESAALSTLSRKELLLRSINLTITHPIFGVGPGMFQVADARTAEEAHERPAWHVTHNTFTQVSSEEGFPGLFLYVAALVFCFKAVRSARQYAAAHPDMHWLGDMAFCTRLSLIAFTVTAIFASNAYYFYFPLVAGLCAALERAVKSEIQSAKALQDTANPPVPLPVPRRPARSALPARSV